MAQKEGENEVVVVDNDTSSSIIPIAARQYADHPQYQEVLAALNSKKHSRLAEKKVVLKMFRMSEIDDVEGYCRDLWISHGRHLFESIRVNTTTDSQINKLTTSFVAETLADLYVLNEWVLELPPADGRRLRNDPSLKTKKGFSSLKVFVDTILEKYQQDQLKVSKKKNSRSKANHQATGTRVQDTVPFNPNNMDSEGCPKCKHFYCQPVNTPEEVQAQQKVIDDRFDQRMTEWISKGSKGGKPRRQKSVAMVVACYCCKAYCGLRPDGGNCPTCRAAATAGNSMVSIGGDGKPYCRCEMCKCSCQVSFGLHERRKIALETETQKWMESTTMTPTDTSSYFDQIVRETVQQGTIDAMQEPSFEDDPTSVRQNAFSSAAMGLLSNTHLQSNMPLRNTMTQAIPRTTMTSTGYSIPEMRRRHRLGLDITPATKSATATVTPKSTVASTGAGREKRFYRNGLSPQPLVPYCHSVLLMEPLCLSQL